MGDLRFIDLIVVEDNKKEAIEKCDEDSIVNYVASDFEIIFPRGYSIQYSASKPNNFAKPYASCNVKPKELFEEKTNWDYDFSFIGDERIPTRKKTLLYLSDYFVKNSGVKTFIIGNPKQFSQYSNEQKDFMNKTNMYPYVMENSKFCLCPEGSGLTSIRFFEALAANSIPIFIGNKRAKFPLDWIIDWDKICFRLTLDDFIKGRYKSILDSMVKTNIDEINKRRKYIHEIYNEYLLQNKINIKKFENLVKAKIEQDR